MDFLYAPQSANLACGHCMEVNLTTDLNLVLGIEQVDLTTVLFSKLRLKLLQIIDYILSCVIDWLCF